MSFGTIEAVPVAAETFQSRWNVTVNNYTLTAIDGNGNPVTKEADLETLLVSISTNRATTIELEIKPLSTQVNDRNTRLTTLTNALSTLTGQQALFDSDDPGGTWSHTKDNSVKLTQDSIDIINELARAAGQSSDLVGQDGYVTKSQCEQAIQLVKAEMDKLNNESSSDMTRLQSLVDKRDESYSTASSLMSSVSDTRGNAIRNM